MQVISSITRTSDQGCFCFLLPHQPGLSLDVCAHCFAVWMLEEEVQERGRWVGIPPALSKRRLGTMLHAVAEMEWEKKDLCVTWSLHDVPAVTQATLQQGQREPSNERNNTDPVENWLSTCPMRTQKGHPPNVYWISAVVKWENYCFIRRRFKYPSIESPLELNE